MESINIREYKHEPCKVRKCFFPPLVQLNIHCLRCNSNDCTFGYHNSNFISLNFFLVCFNESGEN